MRHSARESRSGVETPHRWVTLLRALIAFALGVSVLLAGKTKPALTNFIAIYWLLGSALTLRWAVANRRRLDTRLASAAALVGIVASILVLLRLILTSFIPTDSVLALLGVAAVLTGVLRVSGAFHDDPVPVGKRSFAHSRTVLGILEVTLGAVLILSHGQTRPTAIAVGLWGLVAGIVLLYDARALGRMDGVSDCGETK